MDTYQDSQPRYSDVYLPEEKPSADNAGGNQAGGDQDEDGPTNSMDNIVPMEKLKRGWTTLSTMFMATAAAAQTKAVEVYNSEQVQATIHRTAEVVTPAWERTCEVAGPVWERTKNTASVVAEATREKMHEAGEKMRPTVEAVSAQVSAAASEGWKVASEVANNAAEYTNEAMSQWAHTMSEASNAENGNGQTSDSETQYPASAMDSAMRGAPMTV